MSILYTADTDFAQSRLAEHYTPQRKQTLAARLARAAICLACFALIGALLAACGGGGDDERLFDPRKCEYQPENC